RRARPRGRGRPLDRDAGVARLGESRVPLHGFPRVGRREAVAGPRRRVRAPRGHGPRAPGEVGARLGRARRRAARPARRGPLRSRRARPRGRGRPLDRDAGVARLGESRVPLHGFPRVGRREAVAGPRRRVRAPRGHGPRAPGEVGARLGRARRRAARPARRGPLPDDHDSGGRAPRRRGAAARPRPRQLSRRADRVRGEGASRRGLAVPEHPARGHGGLRREPGPRAGAGAARTPRRPAVTRRVPPAEVRIGEHLVRALLAEQHPGLAGEPLTLVGKGWDNVTWRLGPTRAVRLPRRAAAVPSVRNELRWLPELATRLPLPVPRPVASGMPSALFPWPWSVVAWLPGVTADREPLRADQAPRLAEALRALHRPAPPGAPENPWR